MLVSCLRVVLAAWIILITLGDCFAQLAIPETELTPEEQSQLAAQFAPTLIFHPAEKYFPSSPLFAFETGGPLTESSAARLGTPEARTGRYLSLSLEEKAKLATVYFRAYSLMQQVEETIVVEYWFYYVQDTYRVRGNLLPFWFDGSHPNDLEHIRMVLHRQPHNSTLVVAEIYASAHEGHIPSNRYRYVAEADPGRIQILVELGSHANAPDIDGDGVFTPQVDGDSGYKMLWGIRDKGISWTGYDPSYMSARGATSLKFSPATGALPSANLSYRLLPTQSLEMALSRFQLTEKERKAAFETPVSWFTRIMGRSNGKASTLLSPPKLKLPARAFDTGKYSSSERGFLAGVTNLMPGAGVFLGARYSFQNRFKYLPDLMFEADAIMNMSGNRYLSTDAMLTYPIDATTKFMFGTGVVTDSIRYTRYERDWIAAAEVRLGRMRIYAASRSWGQITKSAVDFRMSFFF